ncbi:MAG TPA: FAD-dependent monooxygenase [Ktedonobacteraceae bacterium]|nr:FAD-dependent monooxygenase [Ktedonobacteraceae bacterium]
MNTSSHASTADESTQVLIIGGGLVGLSMSLFLSNHGIASVLIERHPGTAIHPRAMGFTPRTMELFRAVGAEEAIHRVEPPVPEDSGTLLVDSLVGQTFDNFQEDIRSLFFIEDSPARGSAIAQDLLEPVLRKRAEELGGDLRFGCELLTFEQDDEGVTARVRERASGNIRTLRARYLVAADGSQSPIRQRLGIGQHGSGSMGHFISMIFEADLMRLFRERHAVMCFVSNDIVPIGSLVPYPGSSARPDLFRVDVGYDPDAETLADYPEERCLGLIRAAVGLPALPVRLKSVLTWEMNALVADRFQQGRIFLVGDAARTQPPSGGLGGNTGIAEAHNLAWKLALVLRGEAGAELLATYDLERRPLADYTAEQMALLSQQRQTEGSAGITVDIASVNAGYRYGSGAFVAEADTAQLPLIQHWSRWQGQPGTHAPHIVLEHAGRTSSTLDLPVSRFVLLVGPAGQSWREAARNLQRSQPLPLDVYQIGGAAGDFLVADNSFCQAYGLASSGAVLLRPDGFIGWRSARAGEHGEEDEAALARALSTLLFQ